MQMFVFFVWYMIGILPFLIFMEGFNMLHKFLAKRGIEFTMLHYILLALLILLIVVWFSPYR